MCEIFANYLSYFKSEDTKRSLPVKPVCPYISFICQLLLLQVNSFFEIFLYGYKICRA